jgi:hypothetical protein
MPWQAVDQSAPAGAGDGAEEEPDQAGAGEAERGLQDAMQEDIPAPATPPRQARASRAGAGGAGQSGAAAAAAPPQAGDAPLQSSRQQDGMQEANPFRSLGAPLLSSGCQPSRWLSIEISRYWSCHVCSFLQHLEHWAVVGGWTVFQLCQVAWRTHAQSIMLYRT